MKNIPIVGKFLAVFALFGVFALGVALYSSNRIMVIDTAYSDLLVKESQAALDLAQANHLVQTARAAIGDLLMSTTDKENKKALAEMTDARTKFIRLIDETTAILPSEAVLPALKADTLTVLDKTCGKSIAMGVAALSTDTITASQLAFAEECKPALDALGPRFIELTDKLDKLVDARSNDLTDQSESTSWITLASVIGGFLVIALIGFIAVRKWIVAPVSVLSSTMGALADGDFSTVKSGTDRRDEIGQMAKAVQVFKDNGLKARSLEAQAADARNASEAERERVAANDRRRATEMGEATTSLAEGLRRLSSGDLTVHLGTAFAADFEGLRSDFNEAAAKLRESLLKVSQATGAIDSGSRELSESANDLSRRTEQQAASLEETAAALDQITTNVSNSAKRTEEARGVAVAANQSAHESGRVVADAVVAMQRIERSSDQISNIIGVIDEIAFQTNLLALNAGVEAARAGDAGKGFAVVAQEVRELAQRSAQAAKEIKELIRNSAGEVNAGVKLVSATGDALKVIEGHIVSINTQLDAISTSAREQSVGLAEVNTAINQMDQVTQQNAAMVEESTAASASLANEANLLRQIIGNFQLGGPGGYTAFTRPAAPAAASASSRPAPSPARRMIGKVASALGVAPATTVTESWEEF